MKSKSISSSLDDSDCIKEGCDSLISFSNHLMLVLVAVIAFASGAAFQNDNLWSEILFSAGIIFSLVSFYLGYSANIARINGFLQKDENFKLLPQKERITLGLISRIKKFVQFQYTASVLAILCIAGSIWHTIYQDRSDSLDEASCIVKDNGNLECEFVFKGSTNNNNETKSHVE
jgi:hypothetical protein